MFFFQLNPLLLNGSQNIVNEVVSTRPSQDLNSIHCPSDTASKAVGMKVINQQTNK